MNPQSIRPVAALFPKQCVAMAATLACGLLLGACGGGDGAPPVTATPLSQQDATADAANATSTGTDAAVALDTVIDTTSTFALATPQPAGASSDRPQVLTAGAPVTNVTVNCAGGGTATLSITGGTSASELNGQLDAGEHYSVAYARCTGQAGQAQLDGGVEMDVVSADHATSPATLSVNLTVTGLTLVLPNGSATLAGTATVSRSVVVAGGTTTTTSHIAVPGATLATRFNSRSGTFTLSGLDATRTLTAVAGVTAASQYSGHHTLSGTANGRTFSMNVSTTGNVSYDATGALVSGQWTVVRPRATVATVVANGTVVITVDDGNDGTIDHTWTFPAPQLSAAAG
jgi:hypothetical protein